MRHDEYCYLLFGGQDYYPEGGWRDFRGCFWEKADAIEAAKSCESPTGSGHDGWDWWHVVSCETNEIVANGGWRTEK